MVEGRGGLILDGGLACRLYSFRWLRAIGFDGFEEHRAGYETGFAGEKNGRRAVRGGKVRDKNGKSPACTRILDSENNYWGKRDSPSSPGFKFQFFIYRSISFSTQFRINHVCFFVIFSSNKFE